MLQMLLLSGQSGIRGRQGILDTYKNTFDIVSARTTPNEMDQAGPDNRSPRKPKDPVVLHFDSIHHGVSHAHSLQHTAAGDAEEKRALRKGMFAAPAAVAAVLQCGLYSTFQAHTPSASMSECRESDLCSASGWFPCTKRWTRLCLFCRSFHGCAAHPVSHSHHGVLGQE